MADADFVGAVAAPAAAADLLMSPAPVLGLVDAVDDAVDAVDPDFRFFAGGTGVVVPERR